MVQLSEKRERVFFNIKQYSLALLKVILEQGDPFPSEPLAATPIRLMVAAFMLVGIVLSNAYKNSNVYNMIAPRNPVPYTHLKGLVENNFTIYVRSSSVNFFWWFHKVPKWEGVEITRHYITADDTGVQLLSEIKILLKLMQKNSNRKQYSNKSILQMKQIESATGMHPKLHFILKKRVEEIQAIRPVPYKLTPELRLQISGKFWNEEDKLLGEFIDNCDRAALVLPQSLCVNHAKRLRRLKLENVYVGKERLVQPMYVFSLKSQIPPFIIQRLRGTTEAGIWGRWQTLIERGFPLDVDYARSSLKKPNLDEQDTLDSAQTQRIPLNNNDYPSPLNFNEILAPFASPNCIVNLNNFRDINFFSGDAPNYPLILWTPVLGVVWKPYASVSWMPKVISKSINRGVIHSVEIITNRIHYVTELNSAEKLSNSYQNHIMFQTVNLNTASLESLSELSHPDPMDVLRWHIASSTRTNKLTESVNYQLSLCDQNLVRMKHFVRLTSTLSQMDKLAKTYAHVWLSIMKNATFTTWLKAVSPIVCYPLSGERKFEVLGYHSIEMRDNVFKTSYLRGKAVHVPLDISLMKFVSCGRPQLQAVRFIELINVFDSYVWACAIISMLLLLFAMVQLSAKRERVYFNIKQYSLALLKVIV
ncbi:unnamed protein product [Orchesella dallaii]|uniref:Uncharacterized protein n=1 Tax=Orchesella dallaii TaxID=48710 RepID=A0ABP1RBE2_9HEXA